MDITQPAAQNRYRSRPLNIAFDIDDTLWKIRPDHKDQVPDYNLIQVLRWFAENGDHVYIWSAGGIDYAKQIMTKLGLNGWVTAVISKPPLDGNDPSIDISFDDSEITLGKVNVIVDRPHNRKEEL